ncbi:MAG: DUF4249 family protein [Bacteroidia bacterium]|nr:DUF4249 family protein [Bacteroidia bacterium]MCZ2248111.1 hypothetical protein [Bacteroidia bacterium]
MNKYLVIGILLLNTLFSSCKTDVDVIAPYKETAIIYGLLDISQPIQYVKINKAFLGTGDAYAMAQQPDSLNYNPADMLVTIDRFVDEEYKGTITLQDTIIENGKDGVFTKSKNIIYFTRQLLSNDETYKLKVENKKTGYIATSSTHIINNIVLPNSGGSSYTFVGNDNKYTPNNTIEWNTQKYGKIYELTFRFYYKEFQNGNDTVMKYIDWAFSPQYSPNAEGGSVMKKSIKGEEFFIFLQSVKDLYFSDKTKKRIGWRGQIFITAAGEDYQIYKDLNAPYSSNFQEKPIYTNIINGIGIFSTRVTNSGVAKPFSPNTLTELTTGKYTEDLGFIR